MITNLQQQIQLYNEWQCFRDTRKSIIVLLRCDSSNSSCNGVIYINRHIRIYEKSILKNVFLDSHGEVCMVTGSATTHQN